MALTSLEIAHSGAEKQRVAVGDRFTWWDNTEWEILGFTGARIYSPSGLGGTPIVRCRQLSGKPQTQWLNEDGSVDWCGDSVAGALAKPYPRNGNQANANT